MIKQIIISFCLLFSITLLAQQGTSSPYSYYGIGDVKFSGTVESRSMGGISVFPDSIHMNLQNPAQFASLKLTNYALGGTVNKTTFLTEDKTENANRSSIDYLAAAFPLKKFGFAIGAKPFTSVGYRIIDGYSKYDGIGGINKVFIGAGFKLTKKINVGMDFQYNFGNISTTRLVFQDNVQYGTKEYNRSNVTGYNLDFAVAFQTKISPKINFFSSLIFTPQSNLDLENQRNIQIVQFITNNNQVTIENNDIVVPKTFIKLPKKLTFGAGFGEEKKWLLGGEVTYIENSVLSNRLPDIQNATFENSMRYSIGGYFIPKYNSYNNYFSKIVYRGGLRYENTGLVGNNKSIEDFALTFGTGLPIGGTFSSANLGVEFGRKGTTSNNLIRENYINFCLGLSLNDHWFKKRVID